MTSPSTNSAADERPAKPGVLGVQYVLLLADYRIGLRFGLWRFDLLRPLISVAEEHS